MLETAGSIIPSGRFRSLQTKTSYVVQDGHAPSKTSEPTSVAHRSAWTSYIQNSHASTEQASLERNLDYTHENFAHKLKVEILIIRRTVENSTLERISAFPNVHFRAAKSYETIEEVGKRDWKNLLFGYILTRMSPSDVVGQVSGLQRVYYTWAGTFVYTALCLVFPSLHIVLLDSNYVPVTLLKLKDLWPGSTVSAA